MPTLWPISRINRSFPARRREIIIRIWLTRSVTTFPNATSEQEAVGLVLQQLTSQQQSISGVSLDEEATNLITYQQAYEASARVISTVDDLNQTALNMFTPNS